MLFKQKPKNINNLAQPFVLISSLSTLSSFQYEETERKPSENGAETWLYFFKKGNALDNPRENIAQEHFNSSCHAEL